MLLNSMCFLISHVMGIKGEILNYLSLLSTSQTLKIIGFIHNTSGGSFFFFFSSNLYVWSDLLCEYAPEEPRTRLVDNDDLGEKCNTNHICHIWKRNTV